MSTNTLNAFYLKPAKWWLIGILAILPFQNNIVDFFSRWSSKATLIISYIDELTITIFLLLSIIEYYKRREASPMFFF